jgi:hypothetical protein
MFRQVAIAAVMFAGLIATEASAHPHHGFDFGGDCGAWWDEPCLGPGDFYQWREDELGFRTSCAEAKDIVRERGYRKVRTATCGVRAHSFTGWRNGVRFLIKVNGYNGNISSIRRID